MFASAQFYGSGTFWGAVGAIGVVLGIVLTVLYRRQPKRLLLYTVPSAASVLTSQAAGGPARPELQVIYSGDALDDPYIASLHMQTRSSRDIRAADFEQDEPLEFDFGARIVTLLPTSEPLPLARKGLSAEGTKILIWPTLIRNRATARIDVLTDGKPEVRCHSPLADVDDREVPTLPNPRLPVWADRFLRARPEMTLSSAVGLTMLLVVILAGLGHSIWHSEVVAVANFLTVFFTGTTVRVCDLASG